MRNLPLSRGENGQLSQQPHLAQSLLVGDLLLGCTLTDCVGTIGPSSRHITVGTGMQELVRNASLTADWL